MTSKRRPYKTYPKEFKLEAVRLMESSAADVARELGLRRNQLYKWKEQLEKNGDVASRTELKGSKPFLLELF